MAHLREGSRTVPGTTTVWPAYPKKGAFSCGEGILRGMQTPLKDLKDDDLMALLRNHQKGAFEELFRRYRAPLYGFCMSFSGGNVALAEDMLQETWVKLVKNVDRYQPQGKFKSWIFAVARNEALMGLRRRIDLHVNPEESEAQIPSGEDLEMDFLHRCEREDVQNAIEALPDAQRQVLMIWLTEESSYEEMVTATGLSEPAVRSLLFRAKKTLRKKLESK